MKNKGEIRWIQLSDLHMFASTEVERQKKSLYAQFRETIDFFVITGDLHQYNADYRLSKMFLEELKVEMQIKKRILLLSLGIMMQKRRKKEKK